MKTKKTFEEIQKEMKSYTVLFEDNENGKKIPKGTGFIITKDGLIATCSHVIQDEQSQKSNDAPPDRVRLIFADTNTEGWAKVVNDWWCPIDKGDIAILKLVEPDHLPENVKVAPLSLILGSVGHDFQAFGYPGGSPRFGFGQILAEISDLQFRNVRIHQLMIANNSLGKGHSGAAILDSKTQCVVGMVIAMDPYDAQGHIGENAFAVEVDELIKIYPELEQTLQPNEEPINSTLGNEGATIVVSTFGKKDPVLRNKGRYVGLSLDDSMTRILDAETGDEVLRLMGHFGTVTCCAWSPDGQRILSASRDRTIRIWDATSGKQIKKLEAQNSITCCAWSPDGQRILSGFWDEGTLSVWDVNAEKTIITLRGHRDIISSCAWSPDGQRILSASDDKTIMIWNANTGFLIKPLLGHEHIVSSCAWSPNGQRILSGSGDGTLKIWDANTYQEVRDLKEDNIWVESCAWSPDGQRVLSGSSNGALRVWDANNGNLIKTLSGHEQVVSSCAWSPDGKRILSASRDDRTLQLWDGKTYQRLYVVKGPTTGVSSCAWSPDGLYIV